LARLLALALFLLVLTIVIGEGGPPNLLRQPLAVAIELVLMLIMTIGLIAAWRWELAGAAATLLALAALNTIEVIAHHKLASGAFPLFAIPPLLYLAHTMLIRLRGRDAKI